MTDDEIEQEIQAKKLTKPRVTLADMEAAIISEHYFTAADGVAGRFAGEKGADAEIAQIVARDKTRGVLERLTFCILVLSNGYTVTGESACVSPENFDAELGRKIARQNALDKCWPLFGFHLSCTLAAQSKEA